MFIQQSIDWNSCHVGDDEKWERGWNMLSFGRKVPENKNRFEARYELFHIWVNSITCVTPYSSQCPEALRKTLLGRTVNLCGKKITFDDLKKSALEGGVDYMVEAWFSGVPLEHIVS